MGEDSGGATGQWSAFRVHGLLRRPWRNGGHGSIEENEQIMNLLYPEKIVAFWRGRIFGACKLGMGHLPRRDYAESDSFSRHFTFFPHTRGAVWGIIAHMGEDSGGATGQWSAFLE